MRRGLQYSIAALLVALLVAPLSAQQSGGTIVGHVTDASSREPLAGATITVAKTGALSQSDGRFLISDVPAGTYSIRAVMLGYADLTKSVTVTAGQTVTVDFAMHNQALSLSRLVVVAYGHQRAGDITGAVKQISAQQFNQGRIVSPEQLITSKVAGVQVVQSNEPGGSTSIRIRGTTSVNASSDPLFVVDGMPLGTGAGGGISGGNGKSDPLNFLNPNDIKSITVLKDAAAAALYGANAANGVILIETKSGTPGQAPRITYTGSVSASSVARLPDMLTASQFRQAVQQYAPQNVSQLGSANTNWFNQVDRTGIGQEHDLALSGAGQSMDYRISMDYLNQKGVIKGNNLERLTLGLNYHQSFFADRLDFNTHILASREVDKYTPGGVISNAAQMGPTQPVMDASSPTGYYQWPGNTLQSADNPAEILALARDQGSTDRSIGNVQASYNLPFLSGLSAHANVGYDMTQSQYQTFNPSDLHSQLKAGTGGQLYRTNPFMLNTVLETYLDYAAPLAVAPGKVDVTAGYSYHQSHAEYPWFQASNLSTNLLGINGIPTAQSVTNQQDIQDSRLISFWGRLNYNFKDRYLVDFSIRRDGSSRFGPNNAWGVFPAVSAAWRISDESFMKGFTSLSNLKLRASWGKTGNQAFANYQQFSTYLVGNSQAEVQWGNQFVTTIRPSAVDPNIKWESTRTTDVGLDYGFLSQRFTGSFDWYRKNTSNLIFTVPVPAGSNLSNFLTTNIGSMRNQGVEFSLSADILRKGSSGLSWTATFEASHNTNELTSINPHAAGGQTILTGLVSGGVGTYIQVLTPGQPVNSFYVYKTKMKNGKPVVDSAGNPVYVDLNGDTVINQADRRPFHDPAPKWILGQTSNFTYGAWDLEYTLRAYLGSYVYNNVASNLGNYQELSRASPYNLQASVLTTGFTAPQYLSDYYVQDASFLRMDNITLGYSFRYHGEPLRVFGTVQRAFTLTPYKGVDPTAGLNGLDNNIYPGSRTFTAGLTVHF